MSVCVVGGGIAGALTAHALLQAGRDVQVLDAAEPGAATPASAGILFTGSDAPPDSLWAQLARQGHAAWPEFCAGIETEAGFERRGLLCVGANADAVARWASAQGWGCRWLTPQDCRVRFPQLVPPERDAAFFPEVAQVDPRRFIGAFRKRLEHAGVRWETARVRVVLHGAGQVLGVSDGARRWSAQQVVVAAGAWSARLLEDLPPPVSVRPRRGQIVAWSAVDAGDLPVILDGHHYLVARAGGGLLAGATDEEAGFDVGVTAAARAALTAFARRWCPELLAGAPSAQWAGLRPLGAVDGPTIGAHGAVRGVFLNTGHYRHGIVCAPAAADRLARQMCAA